MVPLYVRVPCIGIPVYRGVPTFIYIKVTYKDSHTYVYTYYILAMYRVPYIYRISSYICIYRIRVPLYMCPLYIYISVYINIYIDM